LILVPVVAAAQLEEIVVTGSRIRGGGEEMPAVTLPKTADFLVQNIRLGNDSRSPDLRRQEIVQTIESMMKQAARARNIELSYGQGFLLPIDLSEDALEVIEDNKRSDTSYVDIYVKVKFDPKQDAKAKRYERLTHEEAFRRELKVMDATAFALARENRMPIIVFSILEPGAIEAVLSGSGRATVVGT